MIRYADLASDLRLHGPRRHSALLHVDWWRVCLDEAQVVASGLSGAARMASFLARRHSWCLTVRP